MPVRKSKGVHRNDFDVSVDEGTFGDYEVFGVHGGHGKDKSSEYEIFIVQTPNQGFRSPGTCDRHPPSASAVSHRGIRCRRSGFFFFIRAAIRRVLRLPTTDFYGDKVIGCVDDIFVIFSRGDERKAVAFEGGRTLTVDGRTVPIDRSAAERLFYAAGLADPDGEGVYGNPRSDGAEWSVHFNYGGRKRVITYGGTVIPPFIGTILDAMEGLSERTPGLRSILDSLSVFLRAPCRQLYSIPPRPEFIDTRLSQLSNIRAVHAHMRVSPMSERASSASAADAAGAPGR